MDLIWREEEDEVLIEVESEVPVGHWGDRAGVRSTVLMNSKGSRDRCPHWRFGLDLNSPSLCFLPARVRITRANFHVKHLEPTWHKLSAQKGWLLLDACLKLRGEIQGQGVEVWATCKDSA